MEEGRDSVCHGTGGTCAAVCSTLCVSMLVAKAQEPRCACVTQHLLFLTDIGSLTFFILKPPIMLDLHVFFKKGIA